MHSELPFISVIIPVHNGQRTLHGCLEATLNQTYPRQCFEVIVVDNLSQDRTPQIVDEFASVKLLHQDLVQSSYATRNLGIHKAAGEIVAFTDADCIPAPDWLEKLAAPFQDPSVMAVGGAVLDGQANNAVERFMAETSLFGRYHQPSSTSFLPVLLTNNTAYRKQALDILHGFNDHLYTGGDIDLGWRLQLELGNCIRYAMDAVVFHQHRSNLKSMFRQYRRHGFGEIFIDAMYHHYSGYPRTLRYQLGRLLNQSKAALRNLLSFIYRLMKYPFQHDHYYLIQPLLWFVSETANMWGKIEGLWATQGLRLNPAQRQWRDPGG